MNRPLTWTSTEDIAIALLVVGIALVAATRAEIAAVLPLGRQRRGVVRGLDD